VACSLVSFFFSIHYRIISNKGTCQRRWRNGNRALTTMAPCNLGSDMGTTNTIMGISRLGTTNWLRDSGAILVVLGPLLLASRGTTAVHCCEGDKTRLRTKEDIVEWAHKDGETCMGGHPWRRKCRHESGVPAKAGTSSGRDFR
jgi:hypothetical protein